MTIDERIEALAMYLELTAHRQEDVARRQEDFERRTRERTEQFEREQGRAAERLKRLEDNLIVQGELVARVDRQLGEFALHTAHWVEKTEAWIETAKTQIAELHVLVRAAHERLEQQ
jgi:hypothetical protein